MPISLAMPQFGQSVTEGTVAAWLKAEGDPVERDESLLTISTDKIDTDLPCPESGVLLRVCVAEGKTVAAGTVLAWVGQAGEEVPDDSPPVTGGSVQAPEPSAPKRAPERRSVRAAGGRTGFLSPVVARLAAEHNVDLDSIQGSGRGGRITRKDIERHIADRSIGTAVRDLDTGPQPLTPMRAAIAEHMSRSVRTSPHVTTIHEFDMGAVVRHRADHRVAWEERGLRVTLLAYLMKAATEALLQVPAVNASLTADGIRQFAEVHLGMAVAVPGGLVVPVVRNTQTMSLEDMAAALTGVTEKAHTRKLKVEDLEGGTFTITNHGAGGSVAGTPIIHQPQAAILGFGAVVKRPVVRGSSHLLPDADDAIVIRPVAFCSLSFDHRLLDGAVADEFMTAVHASLQQWS
ncbi:MAG: 2-oxo acid dehydrogenase subunit E2 [Caldilineaceae bacterium SB0665_bin_21]|nr:2-oxo acid dehydrogenase subunit E2 [Caldilineaceae bacterium SB0665_bin_21]MYA03540.1 2-oxo acid dehydrogenase subunit E2 [Caldilineaceae bacterium SB0664_bin_22]MYC62441.1 2-oxo acid dehydrogenase subunit E2 [Caldilineaceae bacterium SB0661_bin_34]